MTNIKRVLVSVALGGLMLVTAASAFAAERWVIQNERLAVTFTPEAQGAVTSLVDKATGRELAAKQPRPQLFQLEGGNATLVPPHLRGARGSAGVAENRSRPGSVHA